jgi:hypothetical protein
MQGTSKFKSRVRKKNAYFTHSGYIIIPGDDKLGIAGSDGPPLSTIDGPVTFAESAVALSTDRVEGWNQIAWAIGYVQAASDG